MADQSAASTRLESERLVLRDWVEADLEAVWQLKSDPEVLRYTDEEPLDRAGALDWLAGAIRHNRARPRRAWNLAIARREGGEVVGWLGIGLPSRGGGPGEYSFGYQLIRRHWGRGYATEAARRILRFAFEELGAHRVYAECDPANRASARVLEKAGMRREAHFRQREQRRGRWCDALQYALVADEWAAGGEPAPAPLVRACQPDDLPAIAELYRRWEAEAITRGLAADSPAQLAARQGPCWFVAESAGRVVGFVGGQLRVSEGLAVIPAGQAYLEVEDLYVQAEHRSYGLGGRLLDRALRAAAERGVERALVYSSNLAWERTVAFYRRHGFEMWFLRMVR
jgi:RimJ/RimL family protein N-acetyltransferase/ribosomal protein S18 acetylase RimI-like enzyme